ncbi:phosphatidylglycerophosphatase and protein-tyrosine phosphatase 1-like [Ciona intestinalis]
MWQYLPKLSFYPTLVYNVLLEKVTSRAWYTRIDGTVLVGALPFRSMTKTLVENEGVKGVVTMNEDYELKRFVNTPEEWKENGVTQLKLTTVDLIAAPSQVDLKKGVDFILEHRERSESVYVHCKAGRTRSATVAVCYLMTAYNWTPTEAINKLKSQRPHVWLRKPQLDSIDCFYKENFDKIKNMGVGSQV